MNNSEPVIELENESEETPTLLEPSPTETSTKVKATFLPKMSYGFEIIESSEVDPKNPQFPRHFFVEDISNQDPPVKYYKFFGYRNKGKDKKSYCCNRKKQFKCSVVCEVNSKGEYKINTSLKHNGHGSLSMLEWEKNSIKQRKSCKRKRDDDEEGSRKRIKALHNNCFDANITKLSDVRGDKKGGYIVDMEVGITMFIVDEGEAFDPIGDGLTCHFGENFAPIMSVDLDIDKWDQKYVLMRMKVRVPESQEIGLVDIVVKDNKSRYSCERKFYYVDNHNDDNFMIDQLLVDENGNHLFQRDNMIQ